VKPFVDVGHIVHEFFLPREIAIGIPVAGMLIVLFILSSFLALVMIKSQNQPKKKEE